MIKKQLLMQFGERNGWRLNHKPKLKTFCLIKGEFVCERYIMYNLPKSKRSLCAQVRSAILPLHIETGKISDIASAY
jgi:hypothetical protein